MEELLAVVSHLDVEAYELNANVIETLKQIDFDAEHKVDVEFPEASSTVRHPPSERPGYSGTFEYYRDARGFWRTIPFRRRRYPKAARRANI